MRFSPAHGSPTCFTGAFAATLEVVLDQGLITSGTLPLEVDPSIQQLLTGTDLISTAVPPWQRGSLVEFEKVRNRVP